MMMMMIFRLLVLAHPLATQEDHGRVDADYVDDDGDDDNDDDI